MLFTKKVRTGISSLKEGGVKVSEDKSQSRVLAKPTLPFFKKLMKNDKTICRKPYITVFMLGFLVGFYFRATLEPQAKIKEVEIIKNVCATPTPIYVPPASNQTKVSWYHAVFDGNNCDDKDCIMANGQPLDDQAPTMACAKEFKLGQKVKFTYKGKTAIGTCSDRGGFEKLGRKFDLTEGLFSQLESTRSGVIAVNYEVINN
jgi:rare lipoprotein A